ncbi:MAG: ferrochelatase [bacterium]|nr:ferrochelatase [bacterium]
MPSYDALLFVSFGGPEGPDDVMPFLENVLRGRNVPRERMLEVAEHYNHFGGVSPINEQNRQLIAAIKAEMATRGIDLPVYWGNRNWKPMLPDTLQQMANDGIEQAMAFFTTAYGSYSSCRQYRENVAKACEAVEGAAPEVHKLRHYFNHPGFVEPMAEIVAAALNEIPAERRDQALVLFTAHSIPNAMAATAPYVTQLTEASQLVMQSQGPQTWKLVYQSRSGPPTQPWLEPDVNDAINEAAAAGVKDIVVAPIGFISDHMEVLYDLDDEAKTTAKEAGVNMVRAGTVGVHPRFVQMVCELMEERMSGTDDRPSLGDMGASYDVCPIDCCKYEPKRPPRPAARP